MEMKIIHSKNKLCSCCMEEHEVKTVCVVEHTSFKNVYVDFDATYFYCDRAEELYADEAQMRENDIAMKDAYRKSNKLLTSQEIVGIREKYSISQMDFCILLGWGGKTITRYETHQVQDKAHDTILKKMDKDPEWFLELLECSRENLAEEAYKRYYNIATKIYELNQDAYLRRAIEAQYARVQSDRQYNGNTELALDKVVDVIRYLAASKEVSNLYKVKLMKMLWFADTLSYKRRGSAITGLVYQALPMGAVPIAHASIINLRGVPCEEVDMGETIAYHFKLEEISECPFLSKDEMEILDIVIDKFGKMQKREIVEFMHKEEAYKSTLPRELISFKYAEFLQI